MTKGNLTKQEKTRVSKKDENSRTRLVQPGLTRTSA